VLRVHLAELGIVSATGLVGITSLAAIVRDDSDLRLAVPTADMRKKLATDYERMSAMIFATPPNFEAVVKSIEDLEHFLNKEPVVG
jgi:hypothetical protein